MMKIDFHTHILPATDDGAKTVDIAVEMLSMLKQQGVDTAVLTPHYYSHLEPIDAFVERRARALTELRSGYSAPVLLHVGAEVYFSEYLFNNKDLSALCIDGTNTMLVELPFNKQVDERMVRRLERLTSDYLIIPVLAHIERYPDIVKSRKLMERLLGVGCVLQVNLSSFSTFGKRRLVSLVKSGYIGALGTDCHNLDSRKPNYIDGYRRLEKVLDKTELEQIQQSMAMLLHII